MIVLGIDPGFYEAASLDGATRWQEIRLITIPLLKPTLLMMLILNMGQIFRSDFGLFYQVPKQQGILFEWTDIINTFTYRALLDGDLAKSAAVNIFQSVIGLILVIGTNMIVKKISPENSMF